MRHLLLAPLLRWLGRLSYPRLFMVTGALFVVSNSLLFTLTGTSIIFCTAAGELEAARRNSARRGQPAAH